MKIIFLDIDFVMANRACLKIMGGSRAPFSQTAVSLLNRLVQETNAKIVLTSQWRRNKSLDSLNDAFLERGCDVSIIDTTPVLDAFSRAEEIATWLEQHESIVTHFCVLDDAILGQLTRERSEEASYLPAIEDNLVLMQDREEGFREWEFEKALKILTARN